MPVVRELINRISFKINPGDKADAENAFKGIKKSASVALKGIGLLTAAGSKMFSEFESNQAVSRFFSRSQEEAEQLAKIVGNIRGNEIISNRELAQAQAQLSKLTVPLEDIEKILPILAEVTVARPDLDFNQVVSLVTQFTKTGDIEALEKIGAVGKDTAEAFRLAQLNTQTAIKGQRNLFNFLSQGLLANEKKIKENADAVRDDLGFAFKEVGKEASDFGLKFGEKTAPAVKELLGLVRDLFKELNESKGFWEGLDTVVGGIVEALKLARDISEALFGDEGIVEKTSEGFISGFAAPMGGGFGDTPPTSTNGIPAEKREDSLFSGVVDFFSDMIPEKGFGESLRNEKGEFKQDKGVFGEAQKIEFGGEITLKGEGVQGMDMKEVQKGFMDNIKESFKAVAAANGSIVGVGS